MIRPRVSAVRAMIRAGQYDEGGRMDRAIDKLLAEEGLDRDQVERRLRAREVAMAEEYFGEALHRIVREGLARDQDQAEILLREAPGSEAAA